MSWTTLLLMTAAKVGVEAMDPQNPKSTRASSIPELYLVPAVDKYLTNLPPAQSALKAMLAHFELRRFINESGRTVLQIRRPELHESESDCLPTNTGWWDSIEIEMQPESHPAGSMEDNGGIMKSVGGQ
ncbi:hypothetical protein IW262DRAFT_1297490 [Armillaria fumosa]|nr:hypothetical protein IW262DRAFT_1297490 [Armillaria fumosa]